MIETILVTGCNGQLGSELKNLSFKKIRTFFFTDSKNLDITKKNIVENFIIKNNIKTIINTAAYTNVNKAEVEIKRANEINAEGVKNLVELSEKYNCKLIHYSTDYVYDGVSKSPIDEGEKTNPKLNGAYKYSVEIKLTFNENNNIWSRIELVKDRALAIDFLISEPQIAELANANKKHLFELFLSVGIELVRCDIREGKHLEKNRKEILKERGNLELSA